MSKMYSVRVVTAVAVALLAGACQGRGSAPLHAKDFCEVFNGYDDRILMKLYEKFSTNIDDNKKPHESMSVSARIKRRLAEKYKRPLSEISLTTHRYIAHKWKYGGSISFADLMILENKYPGCKPEIIDVWRNFCRESNEAIASEFNWQGRKYLPSAYCKVLYYTHLLADWLPPPVNKETIGEKEQTLMSVRTIVLELQLAVESMSREDDHKQYCNDFREKMEAALAAGTSSEKQAEKVLEALKSMKLGTMLHRRFGEHGKMDEKRHPYREEDEQTGLKKAA